MKNWKYHLNECCWYLIKYLYNKSRSKIAAISNMQLFSFILALYYRVLCLPFWYLWRRLFLCPSFCSVVSPVPISTNIFKPKNLLINKLLIVRILSTKIILLIINNSNTPKQILKNNQYKPDCSFFSLYLWRLRSLRSILDISALMSK